MGIPASGPALLDCPCDVDKEHLEVECRCSGAHFIDIPSDLPSNLMSL